mmetsp:Transcript_31619/g.43389  ORF Transcript_31619/g.43389 Transcript_31619/m.43389 type:complete len:720 (-) Transcript_31619:213-2372(-)
MEFNTLSPIGRKRKCTDNMTSSPRLAKVKKSIGLLKATVRTKTDSPSARFKPSQSLFSSPEKSKLSRDGGQRDENDLNSTFSKPFKTKIGTASGVGSNQTATSPAASMSDITTTTTSTTTTTTTTGTGPKRPVTGTPVPKKTKSIRQGRKSSVTNMQMSKRLSTSTTFLRRGSHQMATNAWNYGRENLSKQLSFVTPKAMLKAADPRVFGRPLNEVMSVQGCFFPSLAVPVVVQDSIALLLEQGLNVEGIFRTSGSLKILDSLVAQYNSGERPNLRVLIEEESGISILAGLLKKFLRDLPEPILPFSLYQDFYKFQDGKELSAEDVPQVQELLEKIPKANYEILKRTMFLFRKILENESVTLMSTENLAIVMGPNLLKSPITNPQKVLEEVEVVKRIVSFIIEQSPLIFNLENTSYISLSSSLTASLAQFDSSSSSSKRSSKSKELKKKLKSACSSSISPEVQELARLTPLPSSPLPPRRREVASPTFSTFSLAENTPLPPSPSLLERAQLTPLPSSPLPRGTFSLAQRTPLPSSPPPTASLVSLAQKTPLPGSPFSPSLRQLAERTPLPTSPISPSLSRLAEQTPLPTSPISPSLCRRAEQTPLPTSPISPSLVKRAHQTPLPCSPPPLKKRREEMYSQLELALQTPLPLSPQQQRFTPTSSNEDTQTTEMMEITPTTTEALTVTPIIARELRCLAVHTPSSSSSSSTSAKGEKKRKR